MLDCRTQSQEINPARRASNARRRHAPRRETGAHGVRLTDLVNVTGLKQPTVSRLIGALMREGLIEQDSESRRFYLGVEAFALGAIASARFGIHKLALDALLQLAATTEDSAFLSISRDTVSICLHREEGAFPIRTQVLKAGDRYPLGVGAGSLAILAAMPDRCRADDRENRSMGCRGLSHPFAESVAATGGRDTPAPASLSTAG